MQSLDKFKDIKLIRSCGVYFGLIYAYREVGGKGVKGQDRLSLWDFKF
jgi:hypothetical protein